MAFLADNISIPKYSDITGVPQDAPIRNWSNIGNIVSSLLTYIFPIAGLLTFAYLLYGGFHLMIAQGDENGVKEAKAKITNAIIGFVIIFLAYWIVQALEIILGVQLL